MLVPLDQQGRGDLASQADAYHRLAADLRQAVVRALHEGSKRLLATYLQALLSYPDACCRGETVLDRATGAILASAPALDEDVLYPKEQVLVELVRREPGRGRRVLTFITHTETRDISQRVRTILEREGLRVAVLKGNTVPPDRREAWVASRIKEGIDVLLAHPRLLCTGLDYVGYKKRRNQPTASWLARAAASIAKALKPSRDQVIRSGPSRSRSSFSNRSGPEISCQLP